MWRVFKNKRGYTLVELLVVMGIMAVLGALSYSGYVVFKKQMYVKHVGNQLQTDIRDSFIRSISVKDDGSSLGGFCVDKVAKVRALKIPLATSFQRYQAISYCEDAGSLLKKSSVTINPSDAVGMGSILTSKATTKYKTDSSATAKTTGFVVVAYSSPYGEFSYFYYTGTPGDDDFDQDILTPGAVGSTTAKWIKHSDGSYTVNSNNSKLLDGNATINFLLTSSPTISQDVIINASGGVTLPNL